MGKKLGLSLEYFIYFGPWGKLIGEPWLRVLTNVTYNNWVKNVQGTPTYQCQHTHYTNLFPSNSHNSNGMPHSNQRTALAGRAWEKRLVAAGTVLLWEGPGCDWPPGWWHLENRQRGEIKKKKKCPCWHETVVIGQSVLIPTHHM